MTQHHAAQTFKRFAVAAAELLRRDMDPQFAGDGPSLLFLAGDRLNKTAYAECAAMAKESQMDVIYLNFEPGREHVAPTSVSIFAERWGAVFTWSDCVLWAPKDGGPLLIMPKGLNVCFAHDGRALISFPKRPTHSLRSGIIRARQRLLSAARQVTPEQVTEAEEAIAQAA